MKNLISIVLFLATGSLLSQTELPAYIVTLKGDTVKGFAKLNPKKELEVFEKVVFKDASGVQKNYKPGKISAYGVVDDHYRVLNDEGEPRFFKVLVSGDINLYELGVEAVRMNEVVVTKEYFYTSGNKLVRVKESKFKKQMAERMKDNESIVNSYEDEKDFNTEKAIDLIKSYNAWKAGQ